MSSDDYHSTSSQTGADGHGLSSSVLVLNRSYVAIHIIPAKRAFCLLMKEGAEVVSRYNGTYSSHSFDSWVDYSSGNESEAVPHPDFVRTPRFKILVPRVVRLLSYDKVPQRKVKFCRRNVIARDGNRCQYCGKRVPPSQLSIDHVVPKSLGGSSTWTNVVAACSTCNARKGGRIPQQAHMRLMGEPAAPKRQALITVKALEPRYSIWRDFLGDAALADSSASTGHVG